MKIDFFILIKSLEHKKSNPGDTNITQLRGMLRRKKYKFYRDEDTDETIVVLPKIQ